MRIVSGKFRSKFIKAPNNLPVRPTTDFAKEALFNVLNNRYYFDEIKVLDLFAGTGNISYEFVSRGTNEISAVDSNRHCIKFIQSINDELGTNIKAIESDALSFLKRTKDKFDLIFMDPPYDYGAYEDLINQVSIAELINPEGLLVVEHDKTNNFEKLPNFKECRHYGKVHFSFFEYI